MSLVCRGSDLRRKLFPETLVWELNLFLFNHRTTCCWLIPFKVLFTLVRTKRWHLLDMTSDFFPCTSTTVLMVGTKRRARYFSGDSFLHCATKTGGLMNSRARTLTGRPEESLEKVGVTKMRFIGLKKQSSML